jgi:macrolide transport system ATP-binding/permease protein
MTWLRTVRMFFMRGSRARDIAEELRIHLQMASEARVARGETTEEAAANARREFGNVGHVSEATHEAGGAMWLERLAQDARFGIRMLRRTPGFSLIAILCLALGIGANAALYGWMEGILLRPYPGVANQDRLVAVAGTEKGSTQPAELSWLDFVDLERGSTLFDSFIVSKIVSTTLTSGDRAERAIGLMVSPNYFDALGVRPVLGRGFTPDEATGMNGHPVTVISYKEWKERFRGDRAIIGRTQTYNNVPHVIVGVAPEGFLGTFVGYAMQFWVPTSMQAAFNPDGYKLDDRGARWIEGFARLKPGVTIERAQAEVSAAAKRLETDHPDVDRGRGVVLFPLWKAPFDNAKNLLPTLRVGFGVVLFVLFIACANVANLLLVRSFARRHEMTVRLSLGAARSRLVRQLMTEAVILALGATAGGLLVAYWCRDALVLLFPSQGGINYSINGAFDWRVVALSAAVGLGSTLLFAVVPAFQASNIDLAGALKSNSRSATGNRSRVRSLLVLVQVALSFVLLVGATLVLRSLERMRDADPGFSADSVVTTAVGLFAAGYDTSRAKPFDGQFLQRVRSIAGVEGAALARSTPFSTRPYDEGPIAVDGFDVGTDERPTASYNEVTPGYFATMGIRLLDGRDFAVSDDETSQPVAIVGEAMVATYWRGANPIGKRIQVNGRWRQIVGVAKDIKFGSLLETTRPLFYVPLRQKFSTQVALFVRTPHGPSALTPALVREIHALDPNLAPYEVISLREQLDRSTAAQRVAVTLLTVFGALAVLLAAIGLYGVMAYAVSQSRREIGLRMALGAAPMHVLRLILASGLSLTMIGIGLGAAAALGSTRLLGYMLYRVSPLDPVAFGAALVIMLIAAVAACVSPAWRAARTDPVGALRE